MDGQDPWANLPPAQRQAALAQVLKLGSLGEQSEVIKEQIAQAVAQQKPSGQRGYGLWGGLLTGLGDSMGQIAGVIAEKQRRDELTKLMSEQQAARNAYGEQLLKQDPAAQRQTGYAERMPDGVTRMTGGF